MVAAAAEDFVTTNSALPADTSSFALLCHLVGLTRMSQVLPVEFIGTSMTAVATSVLAAAQRLTAFLTKAHSVFAADVIVPSVAVSASAALTDIPENMISVLWAHADGAMGALAGPTYSACLFSAGVCAGDARFEQSSMHMVCC